ncbi:metallophosphoesterase [Ruminococcaceae bacterium OttesenSCG-928-D13]|nr:metallophosphoesterase [Ruminococcaceae bacterium OttesenSCG-928-D13]
MALFTISDLHLSLGHDKPMDIFKGWEGYLDRLRENWSNTVTTEDTVVVAGDISWAMKLENCDEDFAFIHALPGRKLLMKGNHDYWWSTRAKMDQYLADRGFHTLEILFNNSFLVDGTAVCGTRSWMYEPDAPHDAKVMARENGRLRVSLEHAAQNWPSAERVAFLHYPPVYQNVRSEEVIAILKEYAVVRCYYGHLHGVSIYSAVQGMVDGIDYRLVSADALKFRPFVIPDLMDRNQ